MKTGRDSKRVAFRVPGMFFLAFSFLFNANHMYFIVYNYEMDHREPAGLGDEENG